MRLRSILAVALLVAGAAAYWLSRPRVPRIRRVVLISVDTLRPDHLGAYGYSRPTSPAFDALAARGVLFEDASSPAPWTLPAHATLLTGLYPGRHGLKAHDRYLPPELETLATRLGRNGWVTAAVVNSHNLSARFGLDRGFQEFRYVEEDVARREPERAIVDQALAWLKRHRDARLFLFVHSYDVHSDYASLPALERAFDTSPPGRADGTTRQLTAFREGRARLAAADAKHLVDLYDAGIRQFDDELARLVDGMRQERLLDDALVIVTSDHGEEFFEHGGVLHGRTQYEEVLRVPLVFVGPALPSGLRVAAPVSLLDVLPTTLALVGVPSPEVADGEDLRPLLRGAGPRRLLLRPLFGEADHNNREPDMLRSLRQGRLKLHLDRSTGALRLYDLADDPGERLDVAAARADAIVPLRELLDRFLRIQPVVAPALQLAPEEIEKLRALGYVR